MNILALDAIFVEKKFQISSLRIPCPRGWHLRTPRWPPVSSHCSHVSSAAPDGQSASICLCAHDLSAALDVAQTSRRGYNRCTVVTWCPDLLSKQSSNAEVSVCVRLSLGVQRIANGLMRGVRMVQTNVEGEGCAQSLMTSLNLPPYGCARLF